MKYLPVFIVVVLALIGLPIAGAQSPLSEALIEEIETRISQEMSRQGIPGMSLAIAVDERIRYVNGFGQCDVENLVPTRATTAYRTASIAKPMTSAVVMRLAERGRLDLDAPVQKYLPTFPEKRWPVVSRQLLGHLSGIRHYTSSEEATGTRHFFDIESALSIFADDPLLHEPQTKFLYTTFGYNLLGAVAQRAVDKSFVELLRELVLSPAGMLDTRVDDHFAVIPNRSRGYIRFSEKAIRSLSDGHNLKPGQLYNARLHDTSMKIPGGGLVSTAPDLVRFAMAMDRGKLLKPQTLCDVWTRQATKDGQPTKYGLGWGLSDLDGHRVVSHGGGQAGTATYLVLLPDDDIYVAAMCNLQGAKLATLVKSLALLVQSPPDAPEVQTRTDYQPVKDRLVIREMQQKQIRVVVCYKNVLGCNAGSPQGLCRKSEWRFSPQSRSGS